MILDPTASQKIGIYWGHFQINHPNIVKAVRYSPYLMGVIITLGLLLATVFGALSLGGVHGGLLLHLLNTSASSTLGVPIWLMVGGEIGSIAMMVLGAHRVLKKCREKSLGIVDFTAVIEKIDKPDPESFKIHEYSSISERKDAVERLGKKQFIVFKVGFLYQIWTRENEDDKAETCAYFDVSDVKEKVAELKKASFSPITV